MKRKLHIDQFLYPASDPYEFGPADAGSDRPVIDQDARNAAAQNERATRQTTIVRDIHAASRKELQQLATAINNILWMREAGRPADEAVWTVEAARRIIDIID